MTLAGTCILPSERPEWLAARQSGIGASEAAATIGISPYETALDVYLRKCGLAGPVAENEAMSWGHRLEPLIADAYREQVGCDFTAEQLFVRDPVHSWMLATLDRVRTDGRIVELKSVGVHSAREWGESGSDEVPHYYLAQIVHQMIVTGTEVADVAALIGGNDFRIYTVERDDRVADRIVAMEAEFWGHVERREPPDPEPIRDIPNLARLWPDAAGEISLSPAESELVREWERHGRAIRDLQEAREEARGRLLALLRDAAVARLDDGRALTRRVVSVAETVVTRKPYVYTDLRIKKGG